jgi:hypothetical protein
MVRLSATGVTLEGLKKLVEVGSDLYEKWKKGKVSWVAVDGVDTGIPPEDGGNVILPPHTDPPNIGDPTGKNEKRAMFFANKPTKPHCKRHIYVDERGTLRSLLVCSD